MRTGVRWKIAVAIAAVGALVAVTLSLVVHNAARVSMLDNARDVQMWRLLFAQRVYETSKPKEPRFGTKINDPALPTQLDQLMRDRRRGTYVQEHRGGGPPDVWAAVPLANGDVLSLHVPFADRGATIMKDLDRALIIGSVSVVFGGCALGVLIGGQLSRRLRKAAAAAGRVAQGNTDLRVRDAIGGVVRDETDELARAIDALTDALNERIEAERRVTADIAHELRTPVTGLLTAAELLPPGRPTELVRDRAQAMRTLVEDVLEVARLDGASERAELQEIALGEFVERRVRVFAPDAVIRVVHESWVSTDPRRLERILGNLLANAARHGKGAAAGAAAGAGTGTGPIAGVGAGAGAGPDSGSGPGSEARPVEVTVEGRVVRVRDHGPGFPEALLREGPSRFRTGSADRAGKGHGLGLTIATGQARVLGARLTFRNAAPEGSPEGTGGAIAVLWLPEHAPTTTGSFPVLRLRD
ncbi:sensor histidine kinase [Streptomyces sp. NPDC048718]|uniref:sensor histidine kinase n=1 Tax=Streptomyces sp. NPDC048718 TaxID=3365587 RepID=UPI003716138B